MLKIVEEVTTVYRVLDAADRLIRELPTLIEAEAFKLGFEEAMPAYDAADEAEADESVDLEEDFDRVFNIGLDNFEKDRALSRRFRKDVVADNTRPAWFSAQAAEEIAESLAEAPQADITALDAEVFEDTEPLVTNGSAETIEV